MIMLFLVTPSTLVKIIQNGDERKGVKDVQIELKLKPSELCGITSNVQMAINICNWLGRTK